MFAFTTMQIMYSFVFIIFAGIILVQISGQQIAKTVVSHLDSAVRDTKEKLGFEVDVRGHTGYTTIDNDGVNLTFVLSGRELGSGINPFAKLAFRSRDLTNLTNFGITESDTGSTEPDWNQVFWFLWKKGTEQKWIIKVFDHKSRGRLLGEAELDVDQFVESGQDSTLNLEGGIGKVSIKKTTPIKFKISAKHLSRRDEFGSKSDPYTKVYFRRGEKGPNIKIYTTATIDNVVNADWEDIIEFSNYQRGTDQYLFFKVRDSDSITADDHLGELLVEVDKYVDLKGPYTAYLEESGEHSSFTITPVN